MVLKIIQLEILQFSIIDIFWVVEDNSIIDTSILQFV